MAVDANDDLAEQRPDLPADRQEAMRLVAAVIGDEGRVNDEASESETAAERLLRLRAEQRAGSYSPQQETDRFVELLADCLRHRNG